MGKYNLGATTTGVAMKLDLRLMLRSGQVKNGKRIFGAIEWTRGGSVSFISDCTGSNKFLRLVYSINNGRNTVEMDYRIKLDVVPSNLGIGEVLYLVCPKSNLRARVLYDAYGLAMFAHRDWYKDNLNKRILYNSQQTSKQWYANTRYFDLKREIETLEEITDRKYKKVHYKGKLTRDFRRIEELRQRMDVFDKKRCQALMNLCRAKYGF